jgi:radical SAM protein with 4Fe4S-binding SPASM domain
VILQTNATLIDSAVTQDLADPDRSNLRIQVSLDGASPATHDRLRGAGAFRHAMTGIETLCAAGMGPAIRIAFTEMRHNFHEIPDLLAMLDRWGVGRLIAGAVVKGGRANGSTDLRLPTPNQYRDLLTRYEEDKSFRERYDRMGTLSAIEWLKQGEDTETACGCLETPYIDAAGRLFPCGLFQNPACAVPGAHHRPLSDLFDRGLRQWSDLRLTSRKRLTEVFDCRECHHRNRCGGGCMGRAFSTYGTVMAPEDRCHLRRVIYDVRT